LAALVPESEAFLLEAFQRGESTAHLAPQLLRLLDDYGAQELALALREARNQHTPRYSSVAFILTRRHRQLQRSVPLPVHLAQRPELEDMSVPHPSLEVYDELSKKAR
jgi:hypothetical protein